MKWPLRMLLLLVCLAMMLLLPFTISSPDMLGEMKWTILEEMEGDEEGRVWPFLPAACAEEEASYELPVDFSVPPAPDAAL